MGVRGLDAGGALRTGPYFQPPSSPRHCASYTTSFEVRFSRPARRMHAHDLFTLQRSVNRARFPVTGDAGMRRRERPVSNLRDVLPAGRCDLSVSGRSLAALEGLGPSKQKNKNKI